MKCKFKNMECPHAGKLTYMGDPLFGETPGLHEETICYNDEIDMEPSKCEGQLKNQIKDKTMSKVEKNIIVVEWVDSVRAFDWTLLEDVDEKSLDCISVGFLLKETDNCVTIAQNYGIKPEQVCNIITIPKCSIKNIREIDL